MTQNKRYVDKMKEQQKIEHQKNLELPINKFLNAKLDDGTLKYPLAVKLRTYFINNPDPILNDMRMANALLHELRLRKNNSLKYRLAFEKGEPTDMFDKHEKMMPTDDCYLAHISETHNVHLVLSKLREHLVTNLLAKCDNDLFNFDQYDEFVNKIDKIVTTLGFVLFPDKVVLIEPL